MLAIDEPLLRRDNRRVQSQPLRRGNPLLLPVQPQRDGCLTVIKLAPSEFGDVFALEDVRLVVPGHEEPAGLSDRRVVGSRDE